MDTKPVPQPDPSKMEGTRFGELAVQMGLSKPDQIEKALIAQKEKKDQGASKRIGEVMVDSGDLSLRNVQKVLLNQKKLRGNTGSQRLTQTIGKTIGPYEILSKLGEGGMGSVYKANDEMSGRTVAVKLLSRKVSGDKKLIERFKREAKAVGALNHPNIVTAYGSGVEGEQPYIAMEFVDGDNLGKILKQKKSFPERNALAIIKGIASGLAHAHRRGFVHRDIKPENVLVAKDGTVKVTDLGLAKSIFDDQNLTKTGTAVGTPHFISPEQARGEKNIDHRADIYSMGATLYLFVTGRYPFEGKNRNEIMLKHVKESTINPKDLVPGLSDGCVQILGKMMAKRPKDRYARCEDLIEDIDLALSGQALKKRGADAENAPAAAPAKPQIVGTGKGSTRKGTDGNRSPGRAGRTTGGAKGRRAPKSKGGCLVFLTAFGTAITGIIFVAKELLI